MSRRDPASSRNRNGHHPMRVPHHLARLFPVRSIPLSSLRAPETVSSARRRTLAVRFALLLIAVLVPLLALEVLFRVAGPVLPGNYETGVRLIRHPLYGFYHPPNQEFWIRSDEFITHFRSNAAGERGRSIATEKAPGTFRILVLGDSFVEATQVSEQDRFVNRLETLFNTGGDSTRYEVIDGSCGGWGTGQELLYLREQGLAYQPDLVLL